MESNICAIIFIKIVCFSHVTVNIHMYRKAWFMPCADSLDHVTGVHENQIGPTNNIWDTAHTLMHRVIIEALHENKTKQNT